MTQKWGYRSKIPYNRDSDLGYNIKDPDLDYKIIGVWILVTQWWGSRFKLLNDRMRIWVREAAKK